MLELLQTVRTVGVWRMLRLYRAYRLAWGQVIGGFYTTRVMQALLNVGFFDALQEQGSLNAEVYAQSHGLDAAILKSLCDTLFALRILGAEGSAYTLAPNGRILVEVARGWFDGVYGYEDVFHSLEALLRREKTYGIEVERRSDFIARGSGEMERWIYFPLAIEHIRRRGYRKVLDLGCGDAAFLVDLARNLEGVTGCGIDVASEAIAQGDERVSRAGLEDRIQLFVADITELAEAPEQLRGAEIATTFFVLHEVLYAGDEAVIGLLESFRTLFAGLPLMAFEVARPTPEEMRNRPGMAVQYILQHDLSHQRTVGIQQWRDLFRRAGFRSVEERYLKFARTAIFVLHP